MPEQSKAAQDRELPLTEEEYVQTVDQGDREDALYDAREYLIAGLANQAEWWEHLGDAHRDYAALARAVEPLQAEVNRLRGFPHHQVSWEDVEIALRAALDDDNAVDAAMCLKNLDWIVVRDAS